MMMTKRTIALIDSNRADETGTFAILQCIFIKKQEYCKEDRWSKCLVLYERRREKREERSVQRVQELCIHYQEHTAPRMTLLSGVEVW